MNLRSAMPNAATMALAFLDARCLTASSGNGALAEQMRLTRQANALADLAVRDAEPDAPKAAA